MVVRVEGESVLILTKGSERLDPQRLTKILKKKVQIAKIKEIKVGFL